MALDKEQFQFPLAVTRSRPPKAKTPRVEASERPLPERIAGIDQVLSTHDVERITGKHRCTIPVGFSRVLFRKGPRAATGLAQVRHRAVA
jgi:hypothetical protein